MLESEDNSQKQPPPKKVGVGEPCLLEDRRLTLFRNLPQTQKDTLDADELRVIFRNWRIVSTCACGTYVCVCTRVSVYTCVLMCLYNKAFLPQNVHTVGPHGTSINCAPLPSAASSS